MAIFSDEMGRHTGVGIVAFVGMDGEPGSPYTPLVDGILIQVRLGGSGDAATALIENVTCKLSCAGLWSVPLYVTLEAGGLRTAPASPIPKGIQNCELPVKSGKPIVCEILHVTGATPVTPRIQLMGVFQG